MGCASSSIRSTSRGTSRGSDRLAWMASSRISRSGSDERAGGTAMTDKQRWLVVVLYAAAMAYVEAAVVLYLRTMVDRLDPYQSPPVTLPDHLVRAEMVREVATLIMLFAVGWLAGRTWRSRLGYTLVAFGVWDILYYVYLVPLSGWPRSLLDWDILFLLPLPWWGPVLAPVSIAVLMVLGGTLVSRFDRPERALWAIEPTDQRPSQDHQHGDADRGQHRPPPRQRQQEQDVPVQERARPAAQRHQVDVVQDVPHTKGDERVAQAAAPRPTGQPAHGEQHDQRGHFADHLSTDQVIRQRHGWGLIRVQAVNHGPQIQDHRSLDVGHSRGIEHDDQPALLVGHGCSARPLIRSAPGNPRRCHPHQAIGPTRCPTAR